MLKFLSVADAKAIAAAAAARARDERAMLDYIGVGKRSRRRAADLLAHPFLVLPTAADLDAFESHEVLRLRALLARLTTEQRRELIALVWFGNSVSLDFAAALRRTRRIPPEAQVGYLMSRRLERHIPAGLEKLAVGRERG
jgi:hypothetical protein